MSSTKRLLEERWSVIQEQNSFCLSLPTLKTLDFVADSEVEVPLLNDFIQGISARTRRVGHNMFVPSHRFADFREGDLPFLPATATKEQEARNLMALETWVANH